MTIFERPRTILRWVLPVLCLLGFAAEAHAQATFRGRVATERGEPIAGASVSINELGLTVLTNAQGTYTLTVPAARVAGQAVTISARAIGYRSQARGVSSLSAGEFPADFQLAQDINRLEEVVVTGVIEGVERAKVPFAVGRVTAEDLPVPAMDPVRSLQGKVAGVRIAATSGTPGSTPEILLRGPTSINAQNRGQGPLIIVDGAAMNVGSLQELGGLDIESIEVVKGAAGAALYGTRAANGVITIRTKRGLTSGEGVRLTARAEYGYSNFNVDWGGAINHHLQLDETGKRFCVKENFSQTGRQHCSRTFDWMTEIYRINNAAGVTTKTPQATVYNDGGNATDLRNIYQAQIWPNQYYDMAKSVLARNPTTLTSVDALGRVGSVSFYASAQYQGEGGAVQGLEGIEQLRARVNLDYDLRSDLRVSLSTMFDRSITDLRGGGSSQGGIWGQMARGTIPATDYRALDTLGRPIVRGGGAELRGTGNGAGTFLYDMGGVDGERNWSNDRRVSRFLGSLNARYFPAEWITLEGTFSYDNRDRQDLSWARKGYRSINPSTALNNGQVNADNLFAQSISSGLTATVRRQLTDDLNARFSFSGIYDENSQQRNWHSGQALRVADVYTLTNTTSNYNVNSNSSTTKSVGLYAAANFDYKDRYILEGSYRYDGSSRFGSGNRWAPFNRISGVWRVSEEPFWNVGFMDDFRLRASRGTAGSTPNFTAQYEVYTVTGGVLGLGQAGNSQLKPETTTEIEVGADMTLFGRIGLEATYAHGLTRDQILQVSTPAALGFTSQWQNAGTLENKTWELSATVPIANTRSFYWQVRGTWDRTRTYVKELFVPEFVFNGGTAQGTASFFKIREGERFGTIYGTAKFLTKCSELPASVAADCGTATSSYQVNDEGWLVWVGPGNSWRDGITKNLWTTFLPASQSPFSVPLSFGHPIRNWHEAGTPGQGTTQEVVLGNTLPGYRFTFTNDIQFKNLTLYTLLDATMGHRINNQTRGWGLLDYAARDFDQAGKSVETAKPVGYSWRCGSPCGAGTGGFYDALGANNYNTENGSYAKLREVSLTYKLGPIAGTGDWTLGVVGRNILTITNYSGFDPEVGATAGGNTTGSGLINQTDAFGAPQLRTFTFSVSTRF